MNFYYFETSYQLSYMHLYLLSHFPLSLVVGWTGGGGSAGCYRTWRRAHLSGPRLFTSSPLPPGDLVDPHSVKIPQDSALFLYLRFILFPSPHISLSVSLSAVLLLWPPTLAVSHVSSPASVCGDDFLLDANANFLHCQPCTTETLHTVPCFFLLCCLRTASAALTPFPFLHFLTFLYFLTCQGGPDAPRHAQAARLHPLCVHLGHTLPHRLHPDAVRGRVHPRRRLHRAGSALWSQEVQRLARSASLKVVVRGPVFCIWVPLWQCTNKARVGAGLNLLTLGAALKFSSKL